MTSDFNFCSINIVRHLILFCLINITLLADAQQLYVIKDTADYKLEEIDSAYYFSNGAEMTSDFEIDSSVINTKSGIIRLPLFNGGY